MVKLFPLVGWCLFFFIFSERSFAEYRTSVIYEIEKNGRIIIIQEHVDWPFERLFIGVPGNDRNPAQMTTMQERESVYWRSLGIHADYRFRDGSFLQRRDQKQTWMLPEVYEIPVDDFSIRVPDPRIRIPIPIQRETFFDEKLDKEFDLKRLPVNDETFVALGLRDFFEQRGSEKNCSENLHF